MIEPHRYYRKFKCISEYYDEVTCKVVSLRKTIDLGAIESCEEFSSPHFTDGKKRVCVQYNTQNPPSILRISYDDFDKIHEEYLLQMQKLDIRSLKKNVFNGFVKMYFDKDPRFMIRSTYPKHYIFSLDDEAGVAMNCIEQEMITYN